VTSFYVGRRSTLDEEKKGINDVTPRLLKGLKQGRRGGSARYEQR